MTAPAPLPAVDVDEVSRPFFEAARDGRLLVQRCLQCGAAQLGSVVCNTCFGPGLHWVESSGKGIIHSFVVMHLSYHAAFAPPYRSALVELDEGPRLPAWLLNGAHARIGQAVEVGFATAENGTQVPVARCK